MGKAIPSFPPREVLFDYLKGRWNTEDIQKYIKFSTVVRDVVYNKATDDFTVSVKDLKKDIVMDGERFDYVVVASGHYSVPHVPTFPGVEKFPGRVLHAHDFRDATEFAGKRLLLVGSSYSAEDIALQCLKYGAKQVILTWRTKPLGFKWPKEAEERPLVQRFDGKVATFNDGSTAEVDVDWKRWVARNEALKNAGAQIDFQTDFVTEIARDCGSDFPYKLDVSDIFKSWHHDKDVDILTYRDKSYASKITGTQSPVHHTNFTYALDDSLETFMHQTKAKK